MEIYTLLGVDKAATIDEIRAAYAKKLKEIDMSRDLEGYQNLRAAYNEAVKNVDRPNDIPSFIEPQTVEIKTNPSDIIHETANEPKIEQPKTIVEPVESEITLPKKEIPDRPDSTEISFAEHFNSFLAQKEFYNDFSAWENFLDLFLVESSQSYIVSFLISNFMLLDDNTRLKLIHYCHIDENNFEKQEDKELFITHINRDNFLDYSFYNYIPKDSRNSYFKLKYKLYEIIQKENVTTQLSAAEFAQLKKANYQDDDLNYLLSVYALIKPNSLSLIEIHERLEDITNDKYHHDVAIIENILHLIEHSNHANVTNASIVSLTWVSDDVKEQLINRLNKFKQKKNESKSAPVKTPKQTHIAKPYKPFNPKKAILIFIIGVIILLSLFSLLFSNSSSPSIDNIGNNFNFTDDDEWDNFDDDDENQYDDFDYSGYKLENRNNNVKLNYDIYASLFWDEAIEDEYNSISLQAITFLTDFKSTHSEQLLNMDVTDTFTDVKETHDLDENQNIITYTHFLKDDSLAIKSVTNSENEIISMESVSPDKIPTHDGLGSADATLFFSEDISDNVDSLDDYLAEMEDFHSLYMTDSLYESIELLDEETFEFLANFSYSMPYLADDKTIVLFSINEDNEVLVLKLDNDLKIDEIHGEHFDDISSEMHSIIATLPAGDNYGNPWIYELGRQ